MWMAETAEKTMDRLDIPEDDPYMEMAEDHYGPAQRRSLKKTVVEALQSLVKTKG
jgi:hypothetical protein